MGISQSLSRTSTQDDNYGKNTDQQAEQKKKKNIDQQTERLKDTNIDQQTEQKKKKNIDQQAERLKDTNTDQQAEQKKKKNIDQQTERLKDTLDRIEFQKDGTMIIRQSAYDIISKEFRNLVVCLQNNTASFDTAVLKFQEVFSCASILKLSATAKVSALGQTQTVPVESHQLATALEVLRQLPETLRVLQKWITSVDIKDGSIMFTEQILDLIKNEIKLDTVKVRSDNSIMLPQETVDTILQHTQEYLKFYQESDRYNRQSTGAKSDVLEQHVASTPKPYELSINQKLERASLPPKVTSSERPFIYVEALDPLPSGATNSFVTTLKAELEKRGIKISVIDVKSFNDDESGSNLVMVICNNHSRLQANVANAFRDISRKSYHRILLAVIHCKKERLLPSASSKAELKDDSEFGVIPEVVDFAFDKDEPKGGIYECEFNKQAFETIEYLVESGRLVSMQADASGSSNKKKRTAE